MLLNSCLEKSTNEKDIEIVYIYSYDEPAKIEVINERFAEYEEIIDEAIYNYNNGNGTVLEQITINGRIWTIRKHEDNCFNEAGKILMFMKIYMKQTETYYLY